MRQYFSRVRNHEAVQLFQYLSFNGLYVDVPPDFMIHLSGVPDLKVQYKISEDLIRLFTGDQKTTDQFLNALRNYAMQADLQEFFNENRDFYTSEINAIKKTLSKHDYVQDIEAYYGYGQNSYNVIPSPLFEGNYGLRIPLKDGRYDLYAVIGGSDYKDNNEKMLRYLVWHEFSHSYINPITAEYQEQVNQCAENFEPIRAAMKKNGYSSWSTTINEHIIRAVTIRLTERILGPDQAEKLQDREKQKGFVYVQALCNQLKYYEAHRKEFRTIKDFYPRLLEVFKNKPSGLQKGSINS